MKNFICTEKGCPFEGRYCRRHLGASLKEEKPIAPRSKKLEEVMKKQYRPQVKEMVDAGTMCVVKSPVCTGRAQGFHHLQGRIGKNLTDPKKKVPCCNACNRTIEQNDLWARNNGWKFSKFKKEETE